MREPAARPVRALAVDETTEATRFDPVLTYYADHTPVLMRAGGQTRHGVAAGRVAAHPYDLQVVRWADGGTDHVAPHVLHRDHDRADTDGR
jgi:hypothetical protein